MTPRAKSVHGTATLLSGEVADRRRLTRRLRAWYRENHRDLPWRRTRDPYRIWISEIMLQQTQVATVVPYYRRFLKEFPDVRTLAAANESRVLRLWEGLGYYRRGRQLHAAARRIVAEHAGRLPEDLRTLRQLPGIGRYTAGAILSFAHDQRVPILEANTQRLLARWIGLRIAPQSSTGQKILWSAAEELLPSRGCGEFNQAMMELGSIVCRPTDPDCGRCPAMSYCTARRNNEQDQIPVAGPKLRWESITEVAVVIERRGRVLLRQCPPHERWAGLWDYPRLTVDPSDTSDLPQRLRDLLGYEIQIQDSLMTLRHGVTRFRITLLVFKAQVTGRRLNSTSSVRWFSRAAVHELPQSVTARKISQRILPRQSVAVAHS